MSVETYWLVAPIVLTAIGWFATGLILWLTRPSQGKAAAE